MTIRPLALLLALFLGVSGSAGEARAAPAVSTLSSSPVTVYGAKWCSACKSLEHALSSRKIAFDLIDVDDNPSAFSRARTAAGASNAIPLTSVVRDNETAWIVGADVDAVERALGSR